MKPASLDDCVTELSLLESTVSILHSLGCELGAAEYLIT